MNKRIIVRGFMKKSAGIILYQKKQTSFEVFLVHPGGPFWSRKDDGAWSIPKGEYTEESPLDAAIREFTEETCITPACPSEEFIPLSPVKQSGGKIITAFALNAHFDETKIKSNTFAMEWPPKSGIMKEFPEVDRAGWFDYNTAKKKIVQGQIPMLDELSQILEDL